MSSTKGEKKVQKYASGGNSISIPKNTIENEPVEVLPGTLNIEVGEGARVVLIERCDPAAAGFTDYGLVKVKVGGGAVVNYIILQNLESKADRKTNYRTEVAEGASITWFDLELGGNKVQTDIETILAGERAKGETWGIFFGTGQTDYNINHTTRHMAANTYSRMDTKGLLEDNAKAVYRGCVEIPLTVGGCDAYEKQDTLLLSKNAHINSTPELLIGNNDVKCGHAVTTTRIDKDKLFYFESRGISADEAVRGLAEGHLTTVIEKITDEGLREDIMKIIENKFL